MSMVKKRTAGRKNLSSPKLKVKAAIRPTKSSAAAQSKSMRRKPMQRQPMLQEPKVETAIESVLPIEIDIPFRDAEQVEPQSNFVVEEIHAALEPSIAERTVVDEGFGVENNAHPEAEFSTPESTSAELEVIAEPQPNFAAVTIAPSEAPIESVRVAEPQDIRRTFAFQWNAFLQVLARGWSWLQQRVKTQQAKKRLRVCESVSLGEKRFIAVVQVDGEQFLVGGSSSSVSTLAHLEQPREFSDVFRRYGQSGMQA